MLWVFLLILSLCLDFLCIFHDTELCANLFTIHMENMCANLDLMMIDPLLYKITLIQL